MDEIADYAALLLPVAAGVALAIVSTRLTERLRVPAAAVLLLAAAAASDLSSDLQDAVSTQTVERIAVVALIVILFNGGMDIGWRRLRASAPEVLALGVLGTFITAAVVTAVAHWVLGFSWEVSGVIGAAIAPTDPAVTFSVLGRRNIVGRSGTVLEGEAGVNDPAGIALLIGMVELATHDDASLLVVVREFAVEMSVGAAAGVLGGLALTGFVRRVRLGTVGLYPALVLALAGVLYGATSLAHGSGFLAVFVAGLYLGDARVPYKPDIERFHVALASLAELVVFIALGLSIGLGSLTGEIWVDGIVLAAALAVLARPLAVLLTLGRSRLSWPERGFITWSGLKGAVPILLAAFAILGDVPRADDIYGTVFVVVLLSVVVQGSLVPFVAGALGVPMEEKARLPWEMSFRFASEPQEAHRIVVAPGSRADGASIDELELGEDAWITVLVRDGSPLKPEPSRRLRAGDRVHLVAPDDELSELFLSP